MHKGKKFPKQILLMFTGLINRKLLCLKVVYTIDNRNFIVCYISLKVCYCDHIITLADLQSNIATLAKPWREYLKTIIIFAIMFGNDIHYRGAVKKQHLANLISHSTIIKMYACYILVFMDF